MSLDTQHWADSGAAAFHADLVDTPPRRSVLSLVGLGALLGLLCWVGLDRTWSQLHVVGWVAGGVLLCLSTLLPAFRKSLLRTIHVTPKDFTIVREQGSQTIAWTDLEAAHIQDYPVVTFGTSIRCFQYRAGGRNFEVQIDGFDNDTLLVFREVVGSCLEAHGIPEETAAMPTFQHHLSLAGAWTFVAGGSGMLIANQFGYLTLGTVFGVAVMATGGCLALMTRRERTSRLVLLAGSLLIAGAIAIIQLLGVNLRDTLNDWEKQERSSGKLPLPVRSSSAHAD